MSARPFAEWHEMSPGEQVTAWAGLRAWVTWLHDRYELAIEERLPRCWPQHPGLIEELTALRAWREEIYAAPQPSAQAARYWHTELRQVLHAAAHQYAAGCRAGHRGPATLAAADRSLQQQWAAASPLTGIPPAESHTVRQAQPRISHGDMAALLDTRQARKSTETAAETIRYAHQWWIPVTAGWIRAADPGTTASTSPANIHATREDSR